MKNLLLALLVFMFGCVTTTGTGLEERVTALEDEMMMLQASGVGAVTKVYGRDCIDSETDACAKSMDDIPGVKDSDTRCMILNNNKIVAWYWYDPTSGAAQVYPDVIDDDTQGGNERWILGRGTAFIGSVQFPVPDPSNIATHLTRGDQSLLIWHNRTGLTLNIQEIHCVSDLNGYQLTLFKSASAIDITTANDTPLDVVTTDTVGGSSSLWYKTITTGFDSGAIEDGKFLMYRHDSGVAKAVLCEIKGYLN